ncbi:MAG: DUF3188 domain-containing protein [Synechococcus sp.]|nr:DUF3188 domain-containing protein [Synechococcus sp.]
MSRPRYPLGHVWLSLAAPLLTALGLVALLQRQGSDRLQALPAILVGIGLVISAVVGRRRRRHRLLLALRTSATDRLDA